MIEITKEFIKEILPKREKNSHKGAFGKVLNITGSKKYMGAGMLSSLAALRVGAGYSILCSEEDAIKNYSAMSYDLIYQSHKNFNANIIRQIIEKENISSVVLGCGISTDNHVIDFIDKLLDIMNEFDIPFVIDADALNCISLLNRKDINKKCILTPHPKELSRLIGVCPSYIQADREHFAIFAQEKYNTVVALKGFETLIAGADKEIYKNTTGSSTLAKAGTGDVLAGMMGGFLAQNLSLTKAAILAVYMHGLAADLYAEQYSEYSMLASDLLDFIPLAFKKVLS